MNDPAIKPDVTADTRARELSFILLGKDSSATTVAICEKYLRAAEDAAYEHAASLWPHPDSATARAIRYLKHATTDGGSSETTNTSNRG
jgi:hypothetical protein